MKYSNTYKSNDWVIENMVSFCRSVLGNILISIQIGQFNCVVAWSFWLCDIIDVIEHDVYHLNYYLLKDLYHRDVLATCACFFQSKFYVTVCMLWINIHVPSICKRKKYWIPENFRFPVFNVFTCFEMSWTRFDHF